MKYKTQDFHIVLLLVVSKLKSSFQNAILAIMNKSSAKGQVAPEITISILVAGVLGGLLIVVAVILFCKYCVKKNKDFRR
jgi:predicted CDP-diglyceride synthetase/phosphatidate cytidylyltransferase